MEASRIIQLQEPITVKASNFQNAFEEYSEVIGRRARARRTARKIERVENRARVRAAKQQARTERKVGRQQVRQAAKEARIAKRATAQQARQAKRTAAMQARQERRTARKTARVERRAIGREQEPLEEGMGMEEGASEQGFGAGQETAPQGGFADEGGATEEGGFAEEGGFDEGGGFAEEEGFTEEGGFDEGAEEPISEEETAAEEGEYFDGFEGGNPENTNYEQLAMEGEIYALKDDDFYSFDDYDAADGEDFSEARGRVVRRRRLKKAKVSPKVKKAAMKSEWNKEMVSRLEAQKNQINNILSNSVVTPQKQQALAAHVSKLNRAIASHKNRAVGFDGMLSDYINFDGDTFDSFDGDTFDSADGEDFSDIRGRRVSRRPRKKAKLAVKRKRRAEVRSAKRLAKRQRAAARRASRTAKTLPANVTRVEQSLSPEISENRIVVPASLNYGGSPEAVDKDSSLMNFNGEDAGAPTEYTYSSADGVKNINWKGVLIGASIAALVIYGAKKAKLF